MKPKIYFNLCSNIELYNLMFFLTLSCIFRATPYTPNINPQIVIILYLGTILSKRSLIFGIVLISTIADSVGAFCHMYNTFGSWTFFSYSAYIIIGLLGAKYKLTINRFYFIFSAILSSIGFWLWSNFGVWCLSHMYPYSINGIITCYWFALPFLKSSMVASLVWGLIFVSIHDPCFWRIFKNGTLNQKLLRDSIPQKY